MVRRFLLKIIACSVALWVADYALAGFAVDQGIRGYLMAGTFLGLLHMFVRPVIKLLTLPLMLVTLGFFSVVINAGILWFVARALDVVSISGVLSLLWATAIVSVVNVLLEPRTDN
jgi:putative membrane protein